MKCQCCGQVIRKVSAKTLAARPRFHISQLSTPRLRRDVEILERARPVEGVSEGAASSFLAAVKDEQARLLKVIEERESVPQVV